MGVDNDSFGGNGFTEQNNLMRYNEHNDAVNGMVNGGQGSGSSGENGPGSNDTCVNVNSGPSGVNVGSSLQIAQQPVGGGGIRWERFLPVRSLKVLLVENDDSTRHVVSALLRNCCYEVMTAANGLEAWSVLQDQNSCIDLVLTEVVMPLLSGIGLLCKITSHKKNIPVIMMSSHDSMGIVFNCLSKGAADFLVKPIRKNELKNLWQHVWRRCHSSSVSGSESGAQTKRSAKLRSSDVSETNTCSSENGNDEHDNGSDHGSGTQSSWTKRAVNVDSARSMSPHKLAAPDSTCAQVIQLMPEADNKSWVCDTETKDYYDQYECDNAALGKDLKMGNSGNPYSQCEYQSKKVPAYSVCKRQIKLPELESKLLNIGDNLKNIAPKSSPIASSSSRKIESRDISTPSGSVSISHIKDKACCDTEEAPYLEPTLNRISGVGGGTARPYDRNVLRHSDLSAFSKYNTASSATKIPTGNVDGSSPLDNNSVRTKMETMQNYLSHSSGTPDQQSNGSCNNNVASLNIVAPKAEGFIETPESISAFRSSYSSVFQPLNSSVSSLQPGTTWGTEDDVTGNTPKSQLRSPYQRIQIQRHHHHYHHHVQRVKQHQPQCVEQSLQKMAAAAPQCGSSNAVAEPNEGNSGNCSVNGSVSGSNLGSNGQNGSTTILNARVENTESEHGATGSKGAGSTSGRITGNGADEDRVALREAALTKFRQKRKERCFGKKVRYQSRKRLAEQRPRVRGQFVRQIVSGSSTGKECNQSNDLLSEDNSCNSLQ